MSALPCVGSLIGASHIAMFGLTMPSPHSARETVGDTHSHLDDDFTIAFQLDVQRRREL